MKQVIYILTLILLTSCGQKNTKQETTLDANSIATNSDTTNQQHLTDEQKCNITDFVPKGYVIFEQIKGDLNNDGIDDCVLIIKGTDKSKFVMHETFGELDRNRRGIIVLFNKKDYYELVAKNYDCFSSENEDGGLYFAPELSIKIEKGKLYLHYGHGRYGYWRYTFRHQNSDFELIGYDHSSNRGPVIQDAVSINFLTKKKLFKDNINKDKENSDEEYVEDVFIEKWSAIKIDKLLKLSEIKDFDVLDMRSY